MRGENAAALSTARQALELDPGSARAQTTLAALSVQSGDLESGLEHARRGADLDGADPHVLYNLGLAEHVAGNRREAADAFIRAGAAIGVDVTPWWRRWRSKGEGRGDQIRGG